MYQYFTIWWKICACMQVLIISHYVRWNVGEILDHHNYLWYRRMTQCLVLVSYLSVQQKHGETDYHLHFHYQKNHSQMMKFPRIRHKLPVLLDCLFPALLLLSISRSSVVVYFPLFCCLCLQASHVLFYFYWITCSRWGF